MNPSLLVVPVFRRLPSYSIANDLGAAFAKYKSLSAPTDDETKEIKQFLFVNPEAPQYFRSEE